MPPIQTVASLGVVSIGAAVPGPLRPARLSPWGRLVAASALVAGVVTVVLAVWSVASTQERRVAYTVRGAAAGVSLDVGDADVEVRGGGRATTVAVQHVDRFGFGHGPVTRRTIAGGVFSVRSRCPETVLHGCSVRYRVVVRGRETGGS